MISGILLAAGESSRMRGAFKPLLKWGKRTVIGECVYQMRNSQLAEIFVVLGHREMEIRQSLAGAGVQYAINEEYQRGMLTSIKTGLAQLSPNEDAALIALVDQPMVTKEIINALIDAFNAGDKGIALPTYQGRHGHPIIVAAKYFDDIMQLDENSPEGLREFIAKHRNDTLEVPVDAPAVIEDIDLPEDYDRLSKRVEPIYEFHKWRP
ncbi:nucleotidyltransferase family protein [candidate division KSB1 bacterium]|nr:nucleotidyltransferase family protein [candidate division KSB1 bacterium]